MRVCTVYIFWLTLVVYGAAIIANSKANPHHLFAASLSKSAYSTSPLTNHKRALFDILAWAYWSRNPHSLKVYTKKDKPKMQSLSVMNPLQVLKQRYMLELYRRRLQKQQAKANSKLLKQLG